MKKRFIFLVGIVFALMLAFFAVAETRILVVAKEKIDTTSGSIYLALGNSFYKRGDTETAVKLYLKGLEYEPNNDYVLNNVGFYYYEKGDYANAELYLKRAIKADQYYERARMNLAVLYHLQKRYDEAIQQLIVLRKINDSNPSYHYDLGINLADQFREQKVGNLDDAIKEFETADNLSPGFSKARENIKALHDVKKAMGLA